MNGPQMHLVLNHLPVVGLALGALALLGSFLLRRPEAMRLSLVILVVTGLATVPAFLTGEPAEDGVEHWAGVSKGSIHEHEEAAEIGLVAGIVAAALALAALVGSARKPALATPLTALALVASLGAAGVMGWVAHLGGLVRHPEISSTAAPAGGAAPSATAPDHDDD